MTTSVIDEVDALLANAMLEEAVPLICGENLTVNGTLWPAAIVRGRVKPPRVNSELLEVPEDNVTLEPLALSVPV